MHTQPRACVESLYTRLCESMLVRVCESISEEAFWGFSRWAFFSEQKDAFFSAFFSLSICCSFAKRWEFNTRALYPFFIIGLKINFYVNTLMGLLLTWYIRKFSTLFFLTNGAPLCFFLFRLFFAIYKYEMFARKVVVRSESIRCVKYFKIDKTIKNNPLSLRSFNNGIKNNEQKYISNALSCHNL